VKNPLTRASLCLFACATIASAQQAPVPATNTLVEHGVEQIVFANRKTYKDGHWYANIGYWCDDETRLMFPGEGGPDDGRLCKLDVRTGEVTVLLDAKGGTIRDPHMHYDAKKILFSWRKNESIYHHLYEIDIDGSNITQLTSGKFDDYEPCYLPDGGIAFISTRCNRWVNCMNTQVGVLHRCDGNGNNIIQLSTNIEHDNTPSVLPDGRILYMRWEYVDRHQVSFHHLWTMNPDGSGQMVYVGNQLSSGLFIGAKPIPGTREVVGIDSPGHGRRDHYGHIALFTDQYGPDDKRAVTRLPKLKAQFTDAYPVSKDLFLAARGKSIILAGRDGTMRKVHSSPMRCYEPIPVKPRGRERVVGSRIDRTKTTGQLILVDAYSGRNMEGIKKGDIKKLLVMEILPKPVNFSGGPDLLSWLGTFTLERVLGTVPVEADGSASFILPANRPVFFVALDKNDMSIKRMQSFTSIAPGETTTCLGCHEDRKQAPSSSNGPLAALKRAPSIIEPFKGIPDIIDFHRDIQPILDKNCVTCHNFKDHKGNVVLEGDLSHHYAISWYTLFARKQIADGRNGYANRAPRTIGSSASRLMKKIDGSHGDVKLSDKEWRTVWMWVESAATYVGSYAALRPLEQRKLSGVGPAMRHKIFYRRCLPCHDGEKLPRMPFHPKKDSNRGIKGKLARHERRVIENDPLARFSTHVILNLSRPEQSPILLAPLSKEAGGWASCGVVFTNKLDPDYIEMLNGLQLTKQRLDSIPRYSTPEFKPSRQYVREMKKYGILPESFDLATDSIDVFETDRKYWESFWYKGE
jgi:hypothetical protein